MTAEEKTNLRAYYTRENFPYLVAHSGPWQIFRNDAGTCAAIPREPESGHLPSGYGDMQHVKRMIREGQIAAA